MSTALYSVTSRKMMFNGNRNLEELSRSTDYWYEGVKFWQDRQTDDPEACLLYKIFQDN
nr:MAG TPA: hypothetical protein [Bacteriophage sp.]